mmetsp:Transcript_114220/g.369026  ORF Transcript_114220/g.369026 Transcript_114220/m.369026 type:complete len:231 (-) Transcript_114220:114-806(-)
MGVLGFSVRVVDGHGDLRELDVGVSIEGGAGWGLAGRRTFGAARPGRAADFYAEAEEVPDVRGRLGDAAGPLGPGASRLRGPGRGPWCWTALWTSSRRRGWGAEARERGGAVAWPWPGLLWAGERPRWTPAVCCWASGLPASSSSSVCGSAWSSSGSSSWWGWLASSVAWAPRSGALRVRPATHVALRGLLRARHAHRGGGACARFHREGCGRARGHRWLGPARRCSARA